MSTIAVTNLKHESASGNNITLDSSGRVGVGVSSPAVPLDISGYARASSGILFGTDTAAANALDDYEEGTWTPTWNATLNSGTFAASAIYTKIGNIVTVQMRQTSGNVSWGNGQLIVGGMPFSPSTLGQAGATGTISDSGPTFGGIVLGWAGGGIYAASAASSKSDLVITITFRM